MPPTVPEKSEIFSATPYSVTEVPSIGSRYSRLKSRSGVCHYKVYLRRNEAVHYSSAGGDIVRGVALFDSHAVAQLLGKHVLESLCSSVESGMLNQLANAYGIALLLLCGSGSLLGLLGLLGLLCGGRRFSGRFGCGAAGGEAQQHQCRHQYSECLFHGFFLLKN